MKTIYCDVTRRWWSTDRWGNQESGDTREEAEENLRELQGNLMLDVDE